MHWLGSGIRSSIFHTLRHYTLCKQVRSHSVIEWEWFFAEGLMMHNAYDASQIGRVGRVIMNDS